MKHHHTMAALIRSGLSILAIVLLEIGCRTGVIPHITMVAPSVMFVSAIHALTDPALRQSILTTFQEVAISSVLAIIAGGIIGLGLFAARPLRQIADTMLSAWYAVPLFIFYPVMIVLFGVGEHSIVAISFIFSVAAMILTTVAALERIPRALFKVARLHHLSPISRVWFVMLPAALPNLVVGFRLVLAYSLIATIAAEFILSDVGIGHAISFAYDNFQTARMYGLILIVIGTAVTLNAALSAFVRALGGTNQVKGAAGG
jgi:NitT/TauT family transport system permease protein